jgi:hypothetical protein
MEPVSMRRLAAVTLALALIPAVAGCSAGTNAPTTIQQPSGNGSAYNQGTIQLRGVTVVKGGAGLPIGTFVGTLVNTGSEPDVLTSVTVTTPTGSTTTIVDGGVATGRIVLPGFSSTQVGYKGAAHVDLSGFEIAPTAYSSVVFTFEKAGVTTPIPVMAVQPIGIYAGLGPITS